MLIPRARNAPLDSPVSHSMESPVLFDVRERSFGVLLYMINVIHVDYTMSFQFRCTQDWTHAPNPGSFTMAR